MTIIGLAIVIAVFLVSWLVREADIDALKGENEQLRDDLKRVRSHLASLMVPSESRESWSFGDSDTVTIGNVGGGSITWIKNAE